MRFFTLLTLAVPAISAAFAEASPVDLAPSLVERSPLEKRIALSNTQLCVRSFCSSVKRCNPYLQASN